MLTHGPLYRCAGEVAEVTRRCPHLVSGLHWAKICFVVLWSIDGEATLLVDEIKILNKLDIFLLFILTHVIKLQQTLLFIQQRILTT
jgi:hypothetical protein